MKTLTAFLITFFILLQSAFCQESTAEGRKIEVRSNTTTEHLVFSISEDAGDQTLVTISLVNGDEIQHTSTVPFDTIKDGVANAFRPFQNKRNLVELIKGVFGVVTGSLMGVAGGAFASLYPAFYEVSMGEGAQIGAVIMGLLTTVTLVHDHIWNLNFRGDVKVVLQIIREKLADDNTPDNIIHIKGGNIWGIYQSLSKIIENR